MCIVIRPDSAENRSAQARAKKGRLFSRQEWRDAHSRNLPDPADDDYTIVTIDDRSLIRMHCRQASDETMHRLTPTVSCVSVADELPH